MTAIIKNDFSMRIGCSYKTKLPYGYG